MGIEVFGVAKAYSKTSYVSLALEVQSVREIKSRNYKSQKLEMSCFSIPEPLSNFLKDRFILHCICVCEFLLMAS